MSRVIRPEWNEYFMLSAKLASSRSTCNSRPTGAVIVKDRQILATGYNGASSGMEHCLGQKMVCTTCQGYGTEVHLSGTTLDRDVSSRTCGVCKGKGELPYCHRRAQGVNDHDKQNVCRSNHAEANAIAMAARYGISVKGATIYCTLAPCHICLKLLKAAEIQMIFYEYAYEDLNQEGVYLPENLIRIQIRSEVTDAVLEQLRGNTSTRRLPRTA